MQIVLVEINNIIFYVDWYLASMITGLKGERLDGYKG